MSKIKFISLATAIAVVAFTLSCSESSENGSTSTCGGKEYDATVYSCEKGEIIGSCRGNSYYTEYEYCDNGIIKNLLESSSSGLSSAWHSSSSVGGDPLPSSSSDEEIGTSSSNSDTPSSSSSSEPSSSSAVPISSSSSADDINGSVYYGGKTYRTVKIGDNIWFAENLNYDPGTGNSRCYNGQASNCDIYGRLYDWATAMTVCPEGWHLPNIADWDEKKVPIAYGDTLYFRVDTLFTKGSFGGYSGSGGSFNGGDYGYWWSANEDSYSHARAKLSFYSDSYSWVKSSLLSVRCMQGSSVTPPSSSNSPVSYNGPYGSVTYEGYTYKTVNIGDQVWFAENLNYNIPGSKCYGEDGLVLITPSANPNVTSNYIPLSDSEIQANCNTYGRLYDWSMAMNLPQSVCNSNDCSREINSPHRGICPSGWHIPSQEDWRILKNYVGALDKLKTSSGWMDWGNSGNGTDQYGFSAKPGGFGYSDGHFRNAGYCTAWWQAHDYYTTQGMTYTDSNPYAVCNNSKDRLNSVRCLKD